MIGLIRECIDAFLTSIVFYCAVTAYAFKYIRILLAVDSLMQLSLHPSSILRYDTPISTSRHLT